MENATPSILFSQAFRHSQSDEHVDEIRFSEPVVITACEIIDQQEMPTTSSLVRVRSPQTFSVEIFVHCGGEARFKRLCHAFLYSASAPPLQDAQVAVTDHLVLRGTYDVISVVVYGNLASSVCQISADHQLPLPLRDLLGNDISWRYKELSEVLCPQGTKCGAGIPPLLHLKLVNIDEETVDAIWNVLQVVGQTGRAPVNMKSLQKIIRALVSAVASLRISEDTLPDGPLFDLRPAFVESTMSDGSEQRTGSGLLDTEKDLHELRMQLRQREGETRGQEVSSLKDLEAVEQHDTVKSKIADTVLELILEWIQGSLQVSESGSARLFSVEYLIGGLAAAQLVCTDAKQCCRFVLAGGLDLLMDVVQHVVSRNSATILLALGAVECASRYAFGCEALLGWANHDTTLNGEVTESSRSSTGYSVLVKILLRPQLRRVVQLAACVLHRLRAYELTSALQSVVEACIEDSDSTTKSSSEGENPGKGFARAILLIKQVLELLKIREMSPKEGLAARFSQWLTLDGEDGGTPLSTDSANGATVPASSTFRNQDIDPFLLLVLQEGRFVPMLLAVVSAPYLTALQGQEAKLRADVVGVLEDMLASLLSCRSGLLFLLSDSDASTALLASYQRLQEPIEKDVGQLRGGKATSSTEILCHPQDLGKTFQVFIAVISAMDRLLSAGEHSEESFWILWELSTISRIESGRKALLMLTWFPEVMNIILGALRPAAEAFPALEFGETWQRSSAHIAAEILQAVISHADVPTVTGWTFNAIAMQRALVSSTSHTDGSAAIHGRHQDKDETCCGLLERLDSAVIYRKKGAVGLMKYVSAVLASGSGIFQTTGLAAMERTESDAHVMDQDGSIDMLHSAEPYQRNWTGAETAPPPLSDTAMVQMTIAVRNLALVSSHEGVAAVLHGEGAMGAVYSILNQCSAALSLSLSAYDARADEEDAEFDGTAGDLRDNGKEQLLLELLLPTVMFVLNLLQSLQVAGRKYRSTKLINVLLSLHYQTSSRIASYVSAPLYGWSRITQDFIALRQVLASVLVCWPTFGWTPALFPRLLGMDNSSNTPSPSVPPMEPAVICNTLSLLVNMLPDESPQLCNRKSSFSDTHIGSAVENIFGRQSASIVAWHTQPPYADQFLQAFSNVGEQIGELVVHHISTGCVLLRDMIKRFVVRLACANVDQASTIVRLIITHIRDHVNSSAAESEKESLKGERMFQMVAEFALHPASKLVLLREGVVEVLLKACTVQSQQLIETVASSETDTGFPCTGRWVWIARSFAALCDHSVSLMTMSVNSRHVVADCPSFEDCCSIALWLLTLLQVVPLGKEAEIVLGAFEKLASHKVGRAAIAYVAIQRQNLTSSITEESTDSEKRQAWKYGNVEVVPESLREHQSSMFLHLWERIKSAFLLDKCNGPLVIEVAHCFAMSSLSLSAAGRSTCGVVALSYLFGLGEGFDTEESFNEKMAPVVFTANMLNDYVNEYTQGTMSPVDIGRLSSVRESALQQVHESLTAMLRIIQKPGIGKEMIEKALSAIDRQAEASAGRMENVKRLKGKPPLNRPENDGEKDTSKYFELLREADLETCGQDSRGTLVWECPSVPCDRLTFARSVSKRKTPEVIDVSRKRHAKDPSGGTPHADGQLSNGVISASGSGRPVPSSSTSASILNRRDAFRQRRPNTSRPPSMHVDDYVARERSEVRGSSPAPLQHSMSASGRMLSKPGDEFMVKQEHRPLSATSSGMDEQLQLAYTQEILQTASGAAGQQLQLHDPSKRIPGLKASGTHSFPEKKAGSPPSPGTSELQSEDIMWLPGEERTPGRLSPTSQQALESQTAKEMQGTLKQSSITSIQENSDSTFMKFVTSTDSNQRVSTQMFSGLPSLPDSRLRDSVPPLQEIGAKSSGRSMHSPSISDHSARQSRRPPTPTVQTVPEAQGNTLTHPSSSLARHQYGLPQTRQGTDIAGCPGMEQVMWSNAANSSPQPLENRREEIGIDVPGLVVPPPPARAWVQDVGQPRLESSLSSRIARVMPGQPSPPITSLAAPRPQWPTVDVTASGVPLQHSLESQWQVYAPNAHALDEGGAAFPHGNPGRFGLPPGNSPLPIGHNSPHHATKQYLPPNLNSSQSLPLHGEAVSLDNIPGAGHSSGEGLQDKSRHPGQLQRYGSTPPLLQQMSYVPPAVPVGPPGTPHTPSLALTNIPLQQQRLHMHLQQQQNMMKLQQQQQQQQQQLIQAQQKQLQQHAQLRQMQLLHKQQHMMEPPPTAVQVPLPHSVPSLGLPPASKPTQGLAPGPIPTLNPVPVPAPPPPPPPPPAPAPAPAISTPAISAPAISAPAPGSQQLQQQESTAMLQQMLASPNAIQALLKDQSKLEELLKQHPKLISLLQERMSRAPAVARS